MRLKFDALNRRFFQIVQTRRRFAEINDQPREFEVLLEFGDFDRGYLGRDTMRLWQMRIPIPSPRARAQDRENCHHRRSERARIKAFEPVPAFADSTEPARRSPGNISE